jgi:hypothetical protein
VQTAAGTLEKLIRDRAKTEELASPKQEVAAALDPLIAQLRAALSEPASAVPRPETPSQASDPAKTRLAAEQLAKLLAEFDAGASDFVEANQTALRSLFAGESWDAFTKLVENYSFSEAQEQLEQALKKVASA